MKWFYGNQFWPTDLISSSIFTPLPEMSVQTSANIYRLLMRRIFIYANTQVGVFKDTIVHDKIRCVAQLGIMVAPTRKCQLCARKKDFHFQMVLNNNTWSSWNYVTCSFWYRSFKVTDIVRLQHTYNEEHMFLTQVLLFIVDKRKKGLSIPSWKKENFRDTRKTISISSYKLKTHTFHQFIQIIRTLSEYYLHV